MAGIVNKSLFTLGAGKQSIAAVLIAALVAVVTLLLGLFASVVYTTERDQRWSQLHQTMDMSLAQATAGLALPMWGLDDQQITAIMRASMSQREVYAMTVVMPGRTYRLARDADWNVAQASEDPAAKDLLRDERLVRHASQALGSVQVFVSPRFLEADLSARRTSIVAIILALDVALVMSMALLLWLFALKPMRALQRFAAAVKDGAKPESHPAGTWFYGELKALNHSIREMTDMLDSRYRALRDSEGRLKLAARSASIGIWDWDPLGDHLVWNDEMFRQYGVSKDAFSAKYEAWRDLLHPDDAARAASEFQAALRGEQDFETEFRIRRRNGDVRFIRAGAITLRDESGQCNRIVGVNIDITERRQAEEHVRQLNADLELRVKERTAQLETAVADLARARDQAEEATRTKSDFLANMSHEIRTPMNAIVGLTGLALRTELDARQRGYLGNVRTAADSLLVIIDDILDFSKIEAGKLVMESNAFMVNEVLDKLTSVVALKANEKGLDFLIDVEPDVPMRLVGDSLRLGQVLINLCANAVKFTEHGEVCLSVKRQAVLPGGRVAVRFAVRDTGIGMSQAQMAKLFKPFSQVDASTTRVFGGTGLGLAISQQIVSLMHGEIGVNSEPGQGSEFHFTAQFEMVGTAAAAWPLPDVRLAGLRVLVIDDSVQSRAIVGSLLNRLGCVPTLTDSAATGLTALKRVAGERAFDLIVLDGNMPDVDCAELVSLIRQRAGDAQKMLVLTSFGDEEATRLVLQHGLQGCLRRPLSIETLGDALLAVVDRDALLADRDSARRSEHDEPSAVLRGRRVLLVEDNAINQMIAAELLGDVAGMDVTIAGDGEQALKCLQAGAYDAVLMDIQMPVLDGLEATRLIREDPAYRSLPIIAMTAHAMARDKEKCLSVGMSDCVTKPFEPRQLFSVLAQWMRPQAPDDETGRDAPGLLSSDDASLVGVDFELGLRHCAGRQDLFERIARRFMSTRCFDAEYMRVALARGDLEEAANIAHQQISTAGTLGAQALSAAARVLQISIMAGESRCWPGQLDVFDRHLAAVVSDLRIRLGEDATAPSSSGVRSGRSL